MVSKQLLAWVEQNLKNGHSLEEIHQTLLQYGYTAKDVNQVMNTLEGHPPSQALWSIAGIVLALIIAGGTWMVLYSQPSALLDVEITSLDQSVVSGDDVHGILQISNLGSSRRYDVVIVSDILKDGSAIAALHEEKTVAVETRASIPLKIATKGLGSGVYRWEVDVKYGSESAKAVRSFIVGKRAISDVVTSTLTCDSCDDSNECTSDYCQSGVCVHDPITPCCPNQLCEDGEDALSCSDCETQVELGKRDIDLIAQAVALAKTNMEEALSLCGSIANVHNRAKCFTDSAHAAIDPALCVSIQEPSPRDNCLMFFAGKPGFDVCQNVVDAYKKSGCEALSSMP